MPSIDIQKALLDNAMRFYTDPPLNGQLEIGVRDPKLLFKLADVLYAHNQENRKRFDPIVRPGNKPEFFVRWAFKSKGLAINIELQAAEDRVGITAIGTF